MNKDFCERLKELRLENNMRQIDLARVIIVSNNTISSWERGISSPGIEELRSLAEFFAVSSDYLIGLED